MATSSRPPLRIDRRLHKAEAGTGGRSDSTQIRKQTRWPAVLARAPPGCRVRLSAPGELAGVRAAPRWPHDHEPGDDGANDEREHSSRVNHRHESAVAVFELDVPGRRDSAAASTALALLALARVRAA